MICDRIIPIGWNCCPRCGKRYNARPAVSRISGRSICPDCMIDEALETARPLIGKEAMADEKWDSFKEVVIKASRKMHNRG